MDPMTIKYAVVREFLISLAMTMMFVYHTLIHNGQ